MELKKCPEGHYYDASLYAECPICNQNQDGGHTVPLGKYGDDSGPTMGEFAVDSGSSPTEPVSAGVGATMPLNDSVGHTMPLSQGMTAPSGPSTGTSASGAFDRRPRRQNLDEGQTIAVVHETLGMNPVVGWLISINGPEKGRDYRIHSDNNYIGRSEKMDICIRGDETISRVNHAVIAYDARDKQFYFANSEGRSLVRLNGKAVLSMVELNAYDVVEIGQTKLVFVPLCGERFSWEDVE